MKLDFDPADIRELVRPVIEECLSAVDTKQLGDDAIAVTEAEAARRLGMASHQLRDRRLAGEIVGSKLGGRWFYGTEELRDYVRRNRADH